MMQKELRIDFQGVVAFVPNRAFAKQPTRMDVVLRNLQEPTPIADTAGKEHVVGSHNAWLEFPPEARVKSATEPDGIAEVTRNGGGTTVSIVLLERQYVSIQLDGKPLPAGNITVDPSLLDHLAVYQGKLKPLFRPNKAGSKDVAAAVPLRGGQLAAVESTKFVYDVPRHDGKSARVGVATTLRWTIPFQKEVTLSFVGTPKARILRLRPKAGVLQLAVRNRELDELFKPPTPARGGQDDPEFLVYGDMIDGGRPQVLRNADPAVPAGLRACGTGGIQP